MRSSLVSTVLLFLTALIWSSAGLESLPNSPCAIQCGNALGGTTGADIVCNNGDFSGTAAGQTFQSCVTCQLGSTYVDPVTKQTDLQWALYNLRYAMSWCLFGFPNNTNVGDTPCITSTACGPLENAIEFDSLSSDASAYAYCSLFTVASIPKCNDCLSVQTSQYYLLNFMTALNGACQQMPPTGQTLSLQGSLFSLTATNITSPTGTPNSSYKPSGSKVGLGVKIGIAIGCSLVVLGIAGFCIVRRGRQRRRSLLLKHQQETGYSAWLSAQHNRGSVLSTQPRDMSEAGGSAVSGKGAFYDSPSSQRPLVSKIPWRAGRREDDTPISADSEKMQQFSPYSSQYSSPVSATDQISMFGQECPVDRKPNVNSYAGGLSAFPKRRSRSTEKKGTLRGDFELQTVAPMHTPAPTSTSKVVPMLKHPRGRGASEDYGKGSAL